MLRKGDSNPSLHGMFLPVASWAEWWGQYSQVDESGGGVEENREEGRERSADKVREKGRKEGRKEGRKGGRKEGSKRGRKEGRKK